jgi:hypothetical protein
VLSLFLLPFGLDSVHKARDWNMAPRVYREAGMALEHDDPARRELDRWMRTATHPRAVFVDTDLGVPVYGQRALYVAMPKQAHLVAIEEQAGVPLPGDGYTLDPRIFMKDVDGYPAALVDRREAVAARLLSGQEYAAADVADVAACGPEAYLVLRSESSGVGRSDTGGFPVVFENAAATVVALRR